MVGGIMKKNGRIKMINSIEKATEKGYQTVNLSEKALCELRRGILYPVTINGLIIQGIDTLNQACITSTENVFLAEDGSGVYDVDRSFIFVELNVLIDLHHRDMMYISSAVKKANPIQYLPMLFLEENNEVHELIRSSARLNEVNDVSHDGGFCFSIYKHKHRRGEEDE